MIAFVFQVDHLKANVLPIFGWADRKTASEVLHRVMCAWTTRAASLAHAVLLLRKRARRTDVWTWHSNGRRIASLTAPPPAIPMAQLPFLRLMGNLAGFVAARTKNARPLVPIKALVSTGPSHQLWYPVKADWRSAVASAAAETFREHPCNVQTTRPAYAVATGRERWMGSAALTRSTTSVESVVSQELWHGARRVWIRTGIQFDSRFDRIPKIAMTRRWGSTVVARGSFCGAGFSSVGWPEMVQGTRVLARGLLLSARIYLFFLYLERYVFNYILKRNQQFLMKPWKFHFTPRMVFIKARVLT